MAALSKIQLKVWGENFSNPNTFIGGIAKTGGTGANAPINSKSLLATKLAIDVNKISGFKVIGDDVSCRIKGTYNILANAFGNITSANANKNITYYLDEDGICLSGGHNVFANCTELVTVKFMSWNASFNNNTFLNCTKLVNAYLNWSAFVVLNGTESFRNTGLTSLNIPNVTAVGGFALFRQSKIATLTAPVLVSCQTFSFAQTLLTEFVIPTFTSFGQSSLFGCTQLTKVETNNTVLPISCLQNCTALVEYTNSNILTGIGEASLQGNKIINFIANNVTAVGSTAFQNATMSLIEIKKCKNIGSNSNTGIFNLSNTGFTIRINVFLATSDSGNAHPALLYAKTNRGAIVEFYDDAGNYVSTL